MSLHSISNLSGPPNVLYLLHVNRPIFPFFISLLHTGPGSELLSHLSSIASFKEVHRPYDDDEGRLQEMVPSSG